MSFTYKAHCTSKDHSFGDFKQAGVLVRGQRYPGDPLTARKAEC